MATTPNTEGLLVEWGDRLFRRRSGDADDASLRAAGGRRMRAVMTAAAVREAIREVLRPGARQVVVKITGGGKGAKAMAAHLRYISRQGQDEVGGRGRTLGVVDERGQVHEGADAMKRLVEDWRSSGAWIPDESARREAFHVIFSMPSGTRADALQEAVAAAAARLYDGHRYAMATHLDQGAPHVHVMIRAERRDGVRLNPRKADLDRWRATFARELQARGIDAVASRQPTRGTNRAQAAVWQIRAAQAGRLRRDLGLEKTGEKARATRADALLAWRELAMALAMSAESEDRRLAVEVLGYFDSGRSGAPRRRFDGSADRIASARPEPVLGPDALRADRSPDIT